MEEFKTYFNIFISLFATNIVIMLGGWDFSLKFLIMLVAFDYITGVLKALYRKRLSSSIGFWGIIKKILILTVVATAAQIDKMVVQDTPVIRTVVIWFYISNEGISMSENLTALGVRIPKIIKDRLLKFNSEQEAK